MIAEWLSFGDYDVVSIIDLPDNVSAAALSIAASASGAIKSIKTTPLMTTEEGVRAMEKAQASVFAAAGREAGCQARLERPAPVPILGPFWRASRARSVVPPASPVVDPPASWPPTRGRPRPEELERPLDSLPGIGKTIAGGCGSWDSRRSATCSRTGRAGTRSRRR